MKESLCICEKGKGEKLWNLYWCRWKEKKGGKIINFLLFSKDGDLKSLSQEKEKERVKGLKLD